MNEFERALRHAPQLIRSHHIHREHHGAGLNGWLAIRATAVLSSMWFFWFCVALDGVELALGNPGSWSIVVWVTYVSQTVIQLLALPLLGAGQRLISAAQDARAEADHETLTALHVINQHQVEILEELRKRG